MKAIYLNIDPYLAAFAAWLKAGKPGTVPSFDPLPLAVTIPLGVDVAIAYPFDAGGAEDMYTSATVNGKVVLFCVPDTAGYRTGVGDDIETGKALGYSSLAPSAKYSIAATTSGAQSVGVIVTLTDEDLVSDVDIPFTVLVRREQAQGPVDLVDFTPPAAAPTAADIKSALVTAGPTALAGVGLGGTYLLRGGEGAYDTPTLVATEYSEGQYLLDGILAGGDEIQAPLGTGSASI